MGFLFDKNKPKVQPVVRMPVPEDKAASDAAERERRRISGRQGRAETILTRNRSAPGAGTEPYKNSFLGQAG